ncbi:MAG: DUF3783 domain-containing protein [Spirochaetes bacterium]|nr:DUF3783 domain-containing protein [Spirochaetota bacterium]
MAKQIRAVIMHGFDDDEAFTIMRAVKALGFGASTTAYATTTPTSLEWKVRDLIEHLAEEKDTIAASRKSADDSR